MLSYPRVSAYSRGRWCSPLSREYIQTSHIASVAASPSCQLLAVALSPKLMLAAPSGQQVLRVPQLRERDRTGRRRRDVPAIPKTRFGFDTANPVNAAAMLAKRILPPPTNAGRTWSVFAPPSDK